MFYGDIKLFFNDFGIDYGCFVVVIVGVVLVIVDEF